MNCCAPDFFGGIGIGRMPNFCHTCGVEARMTSCGCHHRCGCRCGEARHTHSDCGYMTTEHCTDHRKGCCDCCD